MNQPIVVAQLTTSAASRVAAPARTIKLQKPDGNQAHTVQLGYDQNFKIDLSGIANEKITLVHIGERLVILFDNQSTLTLSPFYDSANSILGNITFDVGGGRQVDGSQFAGIFPITEDQSVLPAAGDQGGPQAGANFRDASVDPLLTGDPLPLLPPEALGNFVIADRLVTALTEYPKLAFGGLRAIVEEDELGNGASTSGWSEGNEGPTSWNADTGNEEDFDNDPSTIDGDDDTWQDTDNTTHTFTGQLVMTGGSGFYNFSLVPFPDFNTAQKSQGDIIRVHVNAATGVFTGYVDGGNGSLDGDGNGGDRIVYTMEVSPTGKITFTIFDQLDHDSLDGLPGDNEENNLDLDFSGLILVTDPFAGQALVLDNVELTIIDDVPVLNPFHKNVHVVDEDDIKTLHDGINGGSQGTSPNDGNSDGSYTGSQYDNAGGPATITGSLKGLVKVGADEFPGGYTGDGQSDGGGEDGGIYYVGGGAHFTFKGDASLNYLNNLGLSSKGGELRYDIQGNILYGYVPNFGGGVVGYDGTDRLVFKLTLQPDGEYKFELYDQLDHDKPAYGADQNFDLQDDVPGDVYSIDFGKVIEASDYDGDSIGLDGKLIIKVRDDVPELVPCDPIELVVDEDDIRTELSLGTSPNDGNADGSYTGNPNVNQPGPANVSGSLQGPGGVVISGADEPLTFSFTSNAKSYFTNLGLTSKGEDLSYYIQDGVLYGYVNKQFEGPFGPQDRIVFKFTLEGDGDFKFELFDQLDHDAGNGQNYDLEVEGPDFKWLEFGDVIKATDYDGDSVVLKDMLKIKVRDDVPEVAPCDPIVFTVDEDDIKTVNFTTPTNVNPGSTGTSPNDSNADGSYTGNPANNNPGPAFVSGSLASVVESGADEKLTFSFISESSLRSYLESLGLKSQGSELSYDLQGNKLIAFDNAGNSLGTSYDSGDDRLVFTLEITNPATGEFEFKLYDQLDHDAPNSGSDQNYDLEDDLPGNGDVEYIDFGNILKATDFDGDSVVLEDLVKIRIRDDVPELAHNKTVWGVVEEEHLPLGNDDTTAGPPDLDSDTNANKNITTDTVTGTGANSLAALVITGADENGKFTFKSSGLIGSSIKTTDGDTVTSDGDVVKVTSVSGGSDGGGQFQLLTAKADGRTIFTLKVYANGDWKFDLEDQIDHDDDNQEDYLRLDLAKLLKFTDYDGDSINLDNAEFYVKVIDDIPIADINPKNGGSIVLDETKANSPQDTASDPNADDEEGVTNPFPGFGGLIAYNKGGVNSLFTDNSSVGADQNGDKDFWLSISGTGTNSGLDDVATGNNIYLYKVGNDIYGRVGNPGATSSGTVAFVIRVDDNTGEVRVYQYRALEHDNSPTDHDESTSPEIMDGGKLYLNIKVTDEDGDEDTDSIDLGSLIKFEDDGPKITEFRVKDGAKLVVDESVGTGGSVQNEGGQANNDETGSGDSSDIGYTKVSAGDLFVLNYNAGSDGEKSKVFSLVLNNGSTSLVDTATNSGIVLTLVGGVIYGRSVSGNHLVFKIEVESDGDVIVNQYRAIVHDNTSNHDENGSEAQVLDANKVSLKVTITDKDNDTTEAAIDLGRLVKFEDDGPSVKVEADDHKNPDHIGVTLDETTFGGVPDDNTTTDTWVASTVLNTANAIGRVSTPSSATSNVAISDLFDFSYDAGSDGLQSISHQFGLTLKDHNGSVLPNGSATGVETTMRVTRADGTPLDTSASARTIWLFKQADGSILGVINQNGDGPANDYIALRMFLQDAGTDNPKLVVEQYLPIEHPTAGSSLSAIDEAISLYLKDSDAGIEIAYTVTVTDKDGDTASSTHSIEIIDHNDSIVKIEDDGPSVDVSPALGQGELAALTLNLDETVQPDGAVNAAYDRANGVGEVADGNGGADDIDPAGAPIAYNRDPVISNNPASGTGIGRLSTGAGQVGGLFGELIDFGTDGANDSNSVVRALSFEMGGSSPYATNLIVTGLAKEITGLNLSEMSDTQRTISLHVVNATTIEGRMPGDNGDNFVAFRITIENAGDPANAKIVVEQFLPIDHGNTELGDTETPSILDEQVILKLLDHSDELKLKLTTTVKDGDGDTATDSATVTLIDKNGSFIAFDDDGPAPFTAAASNSAVNGLFFDGFISNSPDWGVGSGYAIGTAGGWTLSPSSVEGAGSPQLEKVGDGYRGADSPSNSVMVDMEASPGNMQISQDLNLAAGETYTVTFEAGMVTDASLANTAILEVYWGATLLGTIVPTPGVLQNYSFQILGTGAPQALTFKEVGDAGDNTGTYLANIKVLDVIIVDETEGLQADSDEVPTLAAIFTNVAVPNQGTDPDMPTQYAQGAAAIVVAGTTDFGTDGPAAYDAVQYGLAASSNGVNSGLKTTEGKPINLYNENGFVVGRFDADGNGSFETAAFALTVDPDTGILSLAQFVSLEHPISPLSHDEGIYLANGTLLATITLTDGDGDKVSSSADVASLVRFEDDGPVVTSVTKNEGYGPELIVNGSFEDGHGLPPGQWNIYANLLTAWTDGSNSVPFELQRGGIGGAGTPDGEVVVELDGDTQGNTDVPLPPQGQPDPNGHTNATIQQTVNGLTVGQTYELSFYYAPRSAGETSGMTVSFGGQTVWTSTGSEPAGVFQKITLVVTAQNASAVLAFTGTGTENEYGALLDNVSLKADYNKVLDDEDLPNGIQNGSGDDGQGLVASGKVNFDAGSDGLKSISIAGFNGLKAVWVNGGVGTIEDVVMTWDAGTKTLTGSTTHIAQVFTLTIDNSGNYVFTLKAPLAHPEQDGPGFENNLNQLDFTVTVTDGDNDTATGVICINVDDDIPVAVDEANLATVEESAAPVIIGTIATLLGNDAFGADGQHATTPLTIGAGSLGGSIAIVAGNLVYTPPANIDVASQVETFTYTIKDGDGDTDTATFTVTVTNRNSIPDIEVQPSNVAVDEDGLLAIRNLDAGPLLPTETDGNELAINTGTVSINYGDDIPANPTTAFSFLLTGLNGQLTTTDGTPVTFAFDGAAILGSAGVNPALRIEITGAVPTGGGEVQYTYQVTLYQPLHHPEATGGADDDKENLLNLLNVQFQVTDSNGDQLPLPGSFNVSILDDVPDATDEAQANVVEGQQALGTFDFVQGADGAKVTHVNGVALDFSNNGPAGYSNPIDLGYGTLEVRANGNYRFTADDPIDNAPPPVINGTFTVTDGDGDSDTANFSFKLLDGNAPHGEEAFAEVDDDGLTGGNPSGQDGDQADANLDLDFNEATFSGNLNGIESGDTPNVYSFSEMHGDAWTLGQESGTYSWNSLTNTLTANIGAPSPRAGNPLFEVKITNTATGDFKVTLLDNVVHQAGPNQEFTNGGSDNQVVLSYRMTDGDDSVDDTGTLTINFDDDAPTAYSDTETVGNAAVNSLHTGNVITGAGTNEGTGNADKPGADGASVTSFIGAGAPVAAGATTAGTHGNLVINADGSYTYTRTNMSAGTDVFTYTLTDGDGDATTATLTFNLDNIDTVPTSGSVQVSLDEDVIPAAPQGNPAGTNDIDAPHTFSGQLPGSFNTNGPALNDAVSFAPMHDTNVVINDITVRFSWNAATDTLTGYADNGNGSLGAGDTTYFTVQVTDPATRAYTVTLVNPLKHHTTALADDVENSNTFDLKYVLTDLDGDPSPQGTLSVTINDDTPTAIADTASVNEGTMTKVDVVFVVDRSGSMDAAIADVPGFSDDRIGLARYAMQQLLENNLQIQNVMFVRFDNGAAATTWMTRAQAEAYVEGNASNQWNLGGNTNYDIALETLKANYASARPGAASPKTVTYFLSDGLPNEPTDAGITNVGGDLDLTNMSITEWQNFVTNPGVGVPPIDQVFAVGIGAGVNTGVLNPISYPNTDTDSNGVENNVVMVTDANGVTDLTNTMQAFLGVASSITGNVLSNIGEGFGEDGGSIKSITINGTEHANNGSSITVNTTLGGKLTFYFVTGLGHQAGDWAYLAPSNVPNTANEVFTYVLVDGDGDEDDATLTITVNNINAAPAGTDGAVAVNEDASVVITAANFGFTDAGDTPPNAFNSVFITQLPGAGTLKLNGVDVTLGQEISKAALDANQLVYTPVANASGNAYATIQFQVKDNGGTANGGVDTDQTANTLTINVTGQNDLPILALNKLPTFGASDAFASNAFNVGTGWTGNWTEEGDATAGVGGGEIRVAGNQLRLGFDGDGASVTRQVNLLGAGSAKLSFTYGQVGTEANQNEDLIVYFAADGTNFIEVGRYDANDTAGTKTLNLQGPFDSDAKVRFAVTATSADDEYFSVDDVVVTASTASTNYSTTYTENAAAISIAAAGPSITDIDDTNMVSAQIVLTNSKAGDVLAWGSLPAGISAVLSSGVGTQTVTLSGNATIAAYAAAIAAVTFSSTAESADDRIINVTVNDGDGNSNTATTTIDYTTVNDAPVAVDDNVIVNTAATNNGNLAIQEWMLMLNDTDADGGDVFAITDVDVGSGLDSATQGAGAITINNGSGNNAWGSFDYNLNGSTSDAEEAIVNVSHDPDGGAMEGSNDANVRDVLINTQNTSNYTINGNDGDDVLIGGSAIDNLNGENGNDILVGRGGVDALSGGAGADTFMFRSGEFGVANADNISDYNFAQGDKIDLTDLLNALYAGAQTSAAVQLVDGAGGNVTVQVDTNTGVGTNWQNVATLTAYDTGATDTINIVLNSLTNQTQNYTT